ncbi:MAG: hypothetical protein BWY53_00689 [Parcubacteria group bacterium ADurb.Bin326]|nr:MAG: hypothetical protein BWY53_00689 [Parcubacteria group bacterium ADurb.Bin326]
MKTQIGMRIGEGISCPSTSTNIFTITNSSRSGLSGVAFLNNYIFRVCKSTINHITIEKSKNNSVSTSIPLAFPGTRTLQYPLSCIFVIGTILTFYNYGRRKIIVRRANSKMTAGSFFDCYFKEIQIYSIFKITNDIIYILSPSAFSFSRSGSPAGYCSCRALIINSRLITIQIQNRRICRLWSSRDPQNKPSMSFIPIPIVI